MKTNYHTHTGRCMHAVGTDEDYIKAAVDAGFDVLGFADHMPWPFVSGYVSPIRMPMSDYPDYMASLRALQQKYAGTIDVRIGLESEWFPCYRDHMLRLRDDGVSYFILGNHYNDTEEYEDRNPYIGWECMNDDGVRRYADTVAEACRTGLFCYLAHPDLFMRHRTADQFNRACEEATDVICQAVAEAGMPIEYNLAGLHLQRRGKDRGYPSAPFWDYARKHDNPVILGVDAHDPKLIADLDLWQDGTDRVTALGYRLVDHLELK